jgi:hypothetical protein
MNRMRDVNAATASLGKLPGPREQDRSVDREITIRIGPSLQFAPEPLQAATPYQKTSFKANWSSRLSTRVPPMMP